MQDNIIELKDVSFKYEDENFVLKNIDMVFKRGTTTAILGANGAGKSTLLLTLNAINRVTLGKIFYLGNELRYTKEEINNIRKSIGIVFQNPDNQIFSASVIEDISFGALNLGLDEFEVSKRVKKAMEVTGIYHLKDRPIHNLSFGQKKRVAIAGILVMEPSVIVLDEPTAGLDPKGVTEIFNLLDYLKKEMNLTIIISTHDMDIVPLYCDYTYIIKEGEVLFHGETEIVFNNANTLREANLRLTRVGHLMEILRDKDGFDFKFIGNTIGKARYIFKSWNSNRNKSSKIN